MKLVKTIAAAALISAAALPVQQAAALAPGDFDASTIVVNMIGASAQRNTLNAAVSSLCAGDVDQYRDKNMATGAVGSRFRSWFCTFAATWPNGDANPLAGRKVLFNVRTKGGSAVGVIPIQEDYTVEHLNILGPNCVDTGSRYECTWEDATRSDGVVLADDDCAIAAAVDGGARGRPVANGKSTLCVKGDMGSSDEEPALFVDENIPAIYPASVDPAAIDAQPAYGVQFGVEVTDQVYRVLQESQGLLATGDADDFTSDAKRPNLTKAQISSIYLGNVTNWNDIAAEVAGGATYPAFGTIGVCRRVNGSGTQAGTTRFFLNRPSTCGGTDFMVTDNTALDGSANGTCDSPANALFCVKENSSSGNVEECLNQMAGVGAPVNTIFGVQGAIGFNAIEKQRGAGDKFQFVKIDGDNPTTADGLAGKYPYFFENSLNLNPGAAGLLDADTFTVVSELRNQLSLPGVIAGLGVEGVWALQVNGFDPNDAADAPTGRCTRNGNSCNEPTCTAPFM